MARGSFKYCGDFSVSFAIHLPQTPALSFQNQFQPALKVGLIRNDKSMLRAALSQKARDTLATLLTLWKNADPDLPTLVAAKSAYAKLQ